MVNPIVGDERPSALTARVAPLRNHVVDVVRLGCTVRRRPKKCRHRLRSAADASDTLATMPV